MEEQALLLASRSPLDEGTGARLRSLLSREVDWSYLIRLAERHCTAPLLSHALESCASGRVPDDARAGLTEHLRGITFRSEQLSDALSALIERFATGGVEAIPLKGPALGELLYGDSSLRPCRDLDVLVRPEQLGEALDLCSGLGYELASQERAVPTRDTGALAAVMRRDYNLSLTRGGSGIALEVHWRPAPQHLLPLDPSWFWKRSVAGTFRATPVRTLCPEDLLITLSAHGTKHWWSRLSWLCDIAQLVRADPPSVARFVEEHAAGIGCRRMCSLALILAGDLLEAPLPPAIRAALDAERAAVALAGGIRRRMFRQDSRPMGEMQEALFLSRAMDQPGRRFRYLLYEARHAVLAGLGA